MSPTVRGTIAGTRSTRRSCASLGWQPEHSFEAGGLEETVDWYRENREWWEPIKSGDYKRYYEQQYATRLAG